MAQTRQRTTWRRGAHAALPVAALGYAAASVILALRGGPVTTSAAASPAAAVADLVAGVGLIAAGALVWRERPGASTGPVAMLLGMAWLGPDWFGWENGNAVARSLGLVAAPFVVPLLAHLALAMPAGRLHAPAARVVVVAAYAVTTVASVGYAVVYDPFLDIACWANCSDNVLVVDADPAFARDLHEVWLRVVAIGGVALATACAWRLLAATRAARLGLAPVLVTAALASVAMAAYAVEFLRVPLEDPREGDFAALFLARAIAFAGVAAGLAWSVERDRRVRAAVARLAADLGEAPQPGSLRAVLAGSLGDDALEVAYWLPGSRRYVDATGRAVDPSVDGSRTATPIVRNGQPVALVLHDRELAGAQRLEQEIGAAARLAVDNERLRAEVLAQLADLRASRARVVEASDTARRRLERDLHDGAQQRLLTLSYELRLARAAAIAADDPASATALASACDETQAALAELRDLAHGIYPAILTEAGLGPALHTLAEDAPLPVELGDVPEARLPAAIERAAYVLVASAIEAAARAAADHVGVTVDLDADALRVAVACVPPAPYVDLAVRVGALGGALDIDDGTLRAVIPCA